MIATKYQASLKIGYSSACFSINRQPVAQSFQKPAAASAISDAACYCKGTQFTFKKRTSWQYE